MKNRYNYILVLVVVGAFFLMPMGINGIVVEETPKFVEFASSPSVNYEEVSGMIQNGSIVSISVVLINFSKEIEGSESELIFHSDLENPVWGISIDGSPEEWKSPFTIDHGKVEEARVTLTGVAPEVITRTEEEITLLNMTHKIKEEYPLLCVKEYVTSEAAENALNAWREAEEAIEEANRTIAKATEAGADVSEAKTNLDLAKVHLKTSQERYNEGNPGEALESAELAFDSAKEAEEKAKTVIGLATYKTYAILAAVAVIGIVAFVFLIGLRRRKRRIY